MTLAQKIQYKKIYVFTKYVTFHAFYGRLTLNLESYNLIGFSFIWPLTPMILLSSIPRKSNVEITVAMMQWLEEHARLRRLISELKFDMNYCKAFPQ